MNGPSRCTIMLAAIVLSAGCGGGQQSAQPLDTRPLEESRALEIIARMAAERGFEVTGPVRVDLGDGEWLECDVLIAGETIAIEFLTAQDRRDGVDIPPAAPGSRLHVIPARLEPEQPDEPGIEPEQPDEPGEDIHVFVIDERKYIYHHNPTSSRRADVTLVEVEDRLRRDLADFFTWYEGTRTAPN